MLALQSRPVSPALGFGPSVGRCRAPALFLVAALAACFTAPVLAADYYVVVPLPGKVGQPAAMPAPTLNVKVNGYALPSAMVGEHYAGFDFNTVLDVSGDAAFDRAAVQWSVVSGALPAGLALGAEGLLSGTPTAAGVSSFQVKAAYKTASGTQAFEILTGEVVVSLQGAVLPAALVGRAYAGFDFNTVLQVSGAESFDGQAVTWELVGGALPAGLTLGADGVLSGTPSVAGTSAFQVKATYQTASGVQAFELLAGEVSVGLAAATLPAAVQGAAYSFDFKPQLTVSGEPAFIPSQVLWTLEGTLPQGLVFNADGTLTGVPTAAGSYPVTVRAQYLNKEGAQSYQVMVGEIVVSLAAVTAPSGVVGQAYAGVDLKPLVSVTGDAAYANTGLSWRVAAGALPAGLTLSEGAISGTPTAKAAGPATVEVSYKGKTAQQPVTIAVSDSIKQFSGYRTWSDGTIAASCLEYKQGKTGYVYAGAVGNGVYRIDVDGAGSLTAFDAFCDMTTDGGGWTVIQMRINGYVDFYRTYAEYANGFGAATSEYWLGNNRIAALTASAKTLRVDMTRTNGQSAYAQYDSFKINGAADKYRLTVSGYTGTAGDSLLGHSGHPFSAKDADHDQAVNNNCAQLYSGAWWYTSCHSSNLNGLYLNGPHASYANGVNWYAFAGHYESLKTVYMKVR